MKERKNIIIASIILIIIISISLFLLKKNDIEVTAKQNNSNDITSTNEEPNENEPYQESTIIENQNSDESNQIELKYDEYVIANGYTGASDNAYYTRNNTLYHLIISKNETIKIAEGVKKIEDDIDTVLVYKGKNFKIIKEDDYVTYID